MVVSKLTQSTYMNISRAPLHKTIVSLQLMVSLQTMVTTIATLLHSQSKSRNQWYLPYTLKTPGSAVTRKRVHWGQTPFRVNDDPEISQIDK